MKILGKIRSVRLTRGTIPLRLGLALVIVTGLIAAPGSVHAQSVDRQGLTWIGGVGGGIPANLYEGLITVTRVDSVDLEPHYRERLLAPIEYRLGTRLDFGRDEFVEFLVLRGRYGSSESEARYRGGGAAPRTINRNVWWAGIDVVGGILLHRGERLQVDLRAGVAWTRWQIANAGPGRAVVARDVDQTEIEWSDRSWSGFGGLIGFGFDFLLTDALSTTLTFGQRFMPVNVAAFREQDLDDLRREIGETTPLSYEHYITRPVQVSLSFGWTPGGRRNSAGDRAGSDSVGTPEAMRGPDPEPYGGDRMTRADSLRRPAENGEAGGVGGALAHAGNYKVVGSIPHQVARFRAADSASYEVEIYGVAPVDALRGDSSGAITRRFMLYHEASPQPLARRITPAWAETGVMSYSLILPAGTYNYVLEAWSDAARAMARNRSELAVGLRDGGADLSLSDLLVVTEARSNTSAPVSHGAIKYEPLRCLALPDDGDIELIFEIYGLTTNDEGRANYRVEANIESGAGQAQATEWHPSLARGLRNPVAGPRTGAVTYERAVLPAPDGRAVEWLALDMPPNLAGPISASITVTDLLADNDAARTRVLSSDSCGS